MKTVLALSLLLITIMSCGGGGQPASGVGGSALAPCVPAPGLSCSNGVYAVLEPGMCASANTTNPSDCPKPYNFCDTNNRCQVQPAQAGSQQIWFATDAIRPGVTVLNSGNDYIYNIMAKGYASLDDWCMSQAQQSTIPAMRNMASWTALIIAQPDSNYSSSLDLNPRYNLLQGINSGDANYRGPSLSAVIFGIDNPTIEDRNGESVSAVASWLGMLGVTANLTESCVNNSCSVIVNGSQPTRNSCFGTLCGNLGPGCEICFCNTSLGCPNGSRYNPDGPVNPPSWACLASTGNLWGGYQNSSGAVFIPGKNGGRSFSYATVSKQSDCGSSNFVLCLANQS